MTGLVLRRDGLRWPFPPGLPALLAGRRIESTGRRGKYLLIRFAHGTLIVHLGMSGHLRMLPPGVPPQKHDHVDLELGEQVLRFTDPRRFGALLWHPDEDGDIEQHLLLRGLGVEPVGPISEEELAQCLHQQTRHRSAAIKQVLAAAIAQGGSSLRDFIGADGASGYFQQSYFVYDREAEPCRQCASIVRRIVQGQRSTFYCVRCQR